MILVSGVEDFASVEQQVAKTPRRIRSRRPFRRAAHSWQASRVLLEHNQRLQSGEALECDSTPCISFPAPDAFNRWSVWVGHLQIISYRSSSTESDARHGFPQTDVYVNSSQSVKPMLK